MSTGTGGGGSGSAGAGSGAGSSGSPAPRAVRPSSGRSPSPFFGRSSSFTKLGVGSAEGPVLPFQSVGEMLASLELEQYAQALDAEGFDSVPRLLMLEEADLDALQVSAQACAFFLSHTPLSLCTCTHSIYPHTQSLTHACTMCCGLVCVPHSRSHPPTVRCAPATCLWVTLWSPHLLMACFPVHLPCVFF